MPRSKQQGRVRRSARTASVPSIPEIKTVIEDHIHTLIGSFAIPNDKSVAAMKRGGIWEPNINEVQSPEILREIACLQRAIDLLESAHNKALQNLD
jgi:hypothetical protein